MSELIRREDLENWLRTECYGTDTYDDKEYVIGRLRKELPTIASSPWHRVEEEPKEPGKQYVVWASKGYACCDKWLGDRWLISSVAPETVTHWMPIEPPKEG